MRQKQGSLTIKIKKGLLSDLFARVPLFKVAGGLIQSLRKMKRRTAKQPRWCFTSVTGSLVREYTGNSCISWVFLEPRREKESERK